VLFNSKQQFKKELNRSMDFLKPSPQPTLFLVSLSGILLLFC
jgi:hypothetical protein